MNNETEQLQGAQKVYSASALPPEELARLTDDIITALKTVYDPEIPADIYELGLIYKVDIEDDRTVKIDMTLTAPGLPRRRRNAGLGAGCRRQCRGRASGRCQHGVRSPVDAGPYERGSAGGGRLVLTPQPSPLDPPRDFHHL